jgi:transposase
MRRCHGCGVEIGTGEKILRTDECPGCGRDLHACRNCRHYAPSAHNQCLEPVAEWVTDKDRANFCDHFSMAETSGPAPQGNRKSPEEEAREKWKKLFKP